MTRVDFYVVAEASEEDAVPTICRLCDKAASADQRVYVAISDSELTRRLDDALWSFRQGSFIAHEQFREQALEAPLPAVLLGAVEPPADYNSILINLCQEVPAYFSRFDRVMEVVCGDPAARQQSRERYRFYRDRGYPLASHPL